MIRKTLTSAAVAAMLLAGGAAQAESDRDAERNAAPADVKVTLQQAIEAAEKHAGGTAGEAELEHENGRAVYEVKVRTDGTTRKVYVSASDGSILSGDDERKGRSDD